MENMVFVFALLLCNGVAFAASFRQDPSVNLKTLVNDYGYAAEVHNVITEDGYILELHRIPGVINKTLSETKKRKVALLLHGLLGSSFTWLVTGPKRSLAFILVDNGYDVWLLNNRGSTYSRKHISKLETSYGFWDFSWHEMGIYDLPATIHYVLNNTDQSNLNLGCFSEGCTQACVMGSLKPEYNEKINFALALAPAVYWTYVGGLVRFLIPFTRILVRIFERVGYFQLLPASTLLRILTSFVCSEKSIFQPVCISVIFSVVGVGYEQLDRANVELFLTYEPAGASIKQLLHYALGTYYPGTFRLFDYGPVRNLRLYNSISPPDYRLENVNIPFAIYHGLNDLLVSPKDIDLLKGRLPNIVDAYLVPGKLNHYDFMLGLNINQLCYKRALALMEKYNQE
ncbi:lipase 3-like isoform X1 [Belonocnema kinseyi]|uniref:lipase 3-like isoform X1 n=1 Tax=Belonocnema kinseyi TaxID=2817044 RepID=UPI00143CE7A5|nr:lipase 3-like isoform X1 [Belonocnema kinseyi]